jgi:hypothetical protein
MKFGVSLTINKTFYDLGQDYRMEEASDIERFALPRAEELRKAITDSITHCLATQPGWPRLINTLNQSTSTCIDISF